MSLDTLSIGLGMDFHRFQAGKPLKLGGLDVPSERGLLAHSDGDVLLHAVLDAVLSAAGLPDLGTLFPDSDESRRGRSSVEMAREVAQRVAAAGARILSIDAVLLAEQPRIAPLRERLRASLADALQIEPQRVNVKGKTYERLGPIGEGLGIEARAVALVERQRAAST
ncbi:MAG: 2-C-methyl-D-erythritol 2,4-cyclodiphosphate synthase [Planctomycetota bacterium]